jgi:hypothetical protein
MNRTVYPLHSGCKTVAVFGAGASKASNGLLLSDVFPSALLPDLTDRGDESGRSDFRPLSTRRLCPIWALSSA